MPRGYPEFSTKDTPPGTRYGRWAVLKQDPERRKRLICCCDCGTEKSVDAFTLRNGESTSCGCSLKPDGTLKDRFLERVKIDPAGCWIWQGGANGQGYGVLRHDEMQHRAHRVSYELFVGPIDDGLLVLHHCDNPPCVRPDHLYAGTAADNARDAVERGRVARGDRHCSRTRPERVPRGDRHGWRTHPESVPRGEQQGAAKLTEALVREIRRLDQAGLSSRAIIAALGLSVNLKCVWAVRRGVTWAHVR